MEIENGIWLLSGSPQSHVYFIQGEENILIDSGFPGGAQKLLKEVQSFSSSSVRIHKILLTHHDIDHVGNVQKLKEWTEAEVWAPDLDIPYILGQKKRPGIKRFIGQMARFPSSFEIHPYTASQHFGDLTVIPAPGHTPGHVIFHFHNVLFAGDLFQIKKREFSLIPKGMTWDAEELKKSIGLLKSLDFDWVCPSHGMPQRRSQAFEKFLFKY